MPSRTPRSRYAAVVDELCAAVAADVRSALERAVASPYSEADVTACLLGRDLWFPSLRAYRAEIEESARRPHLWRFPFGPSNAWGEASSENARRAAAWRALPLYARIVRARIASLAHERDWPLAPASIGVSRAQFRPALTALENAGLAQSSPARVRVAALASPQDLDVDLHLARVLTHWLQSLAHRERTVLRDEGTGWDVHGYGGACDACRERWGTVPRDPSLVPPFHPACRCFAQTRYAS